GLYGIFRHPIYIGSVLFSFGLSAFVRSTSGFWFVSPVFALMCIAYVLGYENELVTRHFGPQKGEYWFSLPPHDDSKPNWFARLRTASITFLPWLIGYEAFILSGFPADGISSGIILDTKIPLISWTVTIYSFSYFFTVSTPFFIRRNKELRHFISTSWIATLVGFVCFLIFPLVVPPSGIPASDFFGEWLAIEKSSDGPMASFPSFHVIWAIIAGHFIRQSFGRYRIPIWGMVILISISCLTTKTHTLSDVLFGVVVGFASVNFNWIYKLLLKQMESISNSWQEWKFGSVRIINHGIYGGLAAFTGVMIISGFLPGHHTGLIAFVLGFSAISGALIWAQVVEGSPILSRPYGYYGSIPGVVLAALLCHWFYPISLWTVLAACSLAAPWVQILGRFRCLVQGCCHGKPCSMELGIRFMHPISRVNKISGLSGESLHPTQLYSMASNLVIGLLLFRLVSLSIPSTVIVGIYLILSSLARFVEEAYRGETQTMYWNGMRLYQWLAIVGLMAGICLTCIPSTERCDFQWTGSNCIWSLAIGILAFVAYGVDFPNSRKPFARLTS
ncbi:MAG TPA: prolipoprotein diacylglyceryl transferase, partial [Catalimonadaceae bacterium]|nr:prolipoprotein diacylglyceryl transferase [Catalimonadaceae bacterium]